MQYNEDVFKVRVRAFLFINLSLRSDLDIKLEDTIKCPKCCS